MPHTPRMLVPFRDDAVALVGFAAFLAVTDFLFWGGAFAKVPGHAYASLQVIAAYSMPCFLVMGFALVACASRAPRTHARLPLLAAGLLIGGTCALAATLSLPVSVPPALAGASVIVAGGIALGFVTWADALRHLSDARLAVVVGGACLLFPLASLALALMPAAPAWLALGALACCSMAAVREAGRAPRHPDEEARAGALARPTSIPTSAGNPGPSVARPSGSPANAGTPHSSAAPAVLCVGAHLPAARLNPCAPAAPQPTGSPAHAAAPRADARPADSCAMGSPARARLATLREAWRAYGTAALGFGAFGFIAGFSRTMSLANTAGDSGLAITLASPAFVCAAGLLVLALWHRRGRLVTPGAFFLASVPVAASGLVLFSVSGLGFGTAFACFGNAFFEFMLVVVTVDALRLARAEPTLGIAPFCLALGCALALACLGTGTGMLAQHHWEAASPGFALTVVVCIYVLAMALMPQLRARRATRAGASQTQERDVALSLEELLSGWVERAGAAYQLTPRERQILDLALRGDDGPAMAQRLGLSENTVRSHRKSLYRKLGVHSKQELLDLVRTDA